MARSCSEHGLVANVARFCPVCGEPTQEGSAFPGAKRLAPLSALKVHVNVLQEGKGGACLGIEVSDRLRQQIVDAMKKFGMTIVNDTSNVPGQPNFMVAITPMSRSLLVEARLMEKVSLRRAPDSDVWAYTSFFSITIDPDKLESALDVLVDSIVKDFVPVYFGRQVGVVYQSA